MLGTGSSYHARHIFIEIRKPAENKRRFFRLKKYTISKLCMKIKQLEISCGIFLDPVIRSTNIREKESIHLLKSIVKKTDREVLQSVQSTGILSLIRSSLILVQAYVAHLKIRFTFFDHFKSKPFDQAVKYFHLVIYKLIPELAEQVMDIVMEFLKTEALWSVEFICCEILMSLLACNTPCALVVSKMLDFLEQELATNNVKVARQVVRVLHKILNEKFFRAQKATDCRRLVDLFYQSILQTAVANQYYQMRRGFELCLIRMCEIISNAELRILIGHMFDLCFGTNLRPEMIADFCHALEMTIMFADFETIAEMVEPQVLQYILEAITSNNPEKSRLASRLLARLFDRHRNFAEFITPRIFLPNKYYKINVSVYHAEDRDFLKQHRTEIEFHLLLALRQHRMASNLETIFTVLCTMLVESPCGYTACQVISILLELQDFALAISDNSSTTETNQMHAVVISVLMLIAWLHRASSLSVYVQRLLNRRADNSPHLNPPLKLTYQYAQHHVQWNEPSLFFDFWEIRYGLWKRFRSNERQLPSQTNKMLVNYENLSQLSSKGNRVQDEIIASNLVRESAETFF